MLVFAARAITLSSRLLRSSIVTTKLLHQLRRVSNMELSDVILYLERIAPIKLAESWDNVGLLIEPSPPFRVSKMLLCNDLTEPVLQECIAEKCDFILSYHPPIFRPFKRLRQIDVKERIVVTCVENRIAVYSPHTSFDAVSAGVNDWLINAFDLESCCSVQNSCELDAWLALDKNLLSPSVIQQIQQSLVEEDQTHHHNDSLLYIKAKHASAINSIASAGGDKHLHWITLQQRMDKDIGMGRVGKLKTPTKLGDLVLAVKTYLGLKYVRLACGEGTTTESLVNSIAVCAGSGNSVLKDCKADLYLTGEMSHHDVLSAVSKGTSVILCEHSNTERGFLNVVKQQLDEIFCKQVEIITSKIDKDPLVVL